MKNFTIKRTGLLFTALAVVFIQSGCNHDDDPVYYPPVFDGSQQSIQNYVTPELLNTMEDLGLDINTGNTPPNVMGEFLDSENRIQATNIPEDTVGALFVDTYFTFSNQNSLTNSIDLSYHGGSETATGTGTVISGSGDHFTIYTKQNVTHPNGTAQSITIVSGVMTEAGITDFQFAVFMLENHGLSGFIQNGTGRVFHDADNLAARQ